MQTIKEEKIIEDSFLTRTYLEDDDYHEAVENAGDIVLENEIQRLRSEVERQGSTVAAKRVLGTKIQILKNNIEKVVEFKKKKDQESRNSVREYYRKQPPTNLSRDPVYVDPEEYSYIVSEGRRGGRRKNKTRSKKTKRSKKTRGRR